MSFSTILGKLLSKDTEARDIAAADYRQLVVDAANDRSVTEAKITTTLTAAGKSLDDLTSDVAAEQRRLRDLSVAARRDEILQALSETNAAIVQEDRGYAADVQRLFTEHGERIAELRARDRQLDEELRLCGNAERRLVATGPDRLAEIAIELRKLEEHEKTWANITRPGSRITARREQHAIDTRREALQAERKKIQRELLAQN